MMKNNIVNFDRPTGAIAEFYGWVNLMDRYLALTVLTQERELRWVVLITSIIQYANNIKSDTRYAILNIHHWQEFALTSIDASRSLTLGNREAELRRWVTDGIQLSINAFGRPTKYDPDFFGFDIDTPF